MIGAIIAKKNVRAGLEALNKRDVTTFMSAWADDAVWNYPGDLPVSGRFVGKQAIRSWYVMPDKRLDMPKLLQAFQQFFRENADAWIERFQYKEAGPQLLLQAFLQRIINGGGRITREYGLGMKRMDLYLEWPLDEVLAFRGPLQRVVLELKIQRGALKGALADGLPQTAGYAATCGADEAHLLIFDRSSKKPWSKKIWKRSEAVDGRVVQVWGM